jgi:hypothetical protein
MDEFFVKRVIGHVSKLAPTDKGATGEGENLDGATAEHRIGDARLPGRISATSDL